jgi:hypothetical protein
VFGQLVHGKDLAGGEGVNALHRGGIIAPHGKGFAAACLGEQTTEEESKNAALNSMHAPALSLLSRVRPPGRMQSRSPCPC